MRKFEENQVFPTSLQHHAKLGTLMSIMRNGGLEEEKKSAERMLNQFKRIEKRPLYTEPATDEEEFEVWINLYNGRNYVLLTFQYNKNPRDETIERTIDGWEVKLLKWQQHTLKQLINGVQYPSKQSIYNILCASSIFYFRQENGPTYTGFLTINEIADIRSHVLSKFEIIEIPDRVKEYVKENKKDYQQCSLEEIERFLKRDAGKRADEKLLEECVLWDPLVNLDELGKFVVDYIAPLFNIHFILLSELRRGDGRKPDYKLINRNGTRTAVFGEVTGPKRQNDLRKVNWDIYRGVTHAKDDIDYDINQRKLLDQEESYDVIIKIGEGNNSREFKVHSLILKARCTYFQSALSNNWARKGEGGIINFNKPNISPNAFEFLLKYFYTAKIDLSKHEITDILQILVAADELNLQSLMIHVEQYLLENQSDLLRKDPIKEEQLSNWSLENISGLRELMQDFIPLIRWFHINSSEFRRKIMPFKKIIPKDLYQEILCHHLDPTYELNIHVLPPRISRIIDELDSVLIEKKHVTIFSNGFEAGTFHRLCDNKGSTITVAKIRSRGQLVGGYNPLDWKPQLNSTSDSIWYPTFDSFLFSFPSFPLSTDDSIPKIPKIARVGSIGNVSEYAIGYNVDYGPSFGGGWDLSIQNNNLIYSYGPYSYPDCGAFVTRNHYLELEEYEVFQIIALKKESFN
ncbi:11911_t:CDS:10 [Funneliformis geosporum]|uniref:11911_t:CDS:1 n=1 Tax=Funneliformis geosporum TaxID=1117311 RepID=A0A9W4WPJ4_9GLOM|nr:11911_t:CDS:10 [Funneliformis geosporum]